MIGFEHDEKLYWFDPKQVQYIRLHPYCDWWKEDQPIHSVLIRGTDWEIELRFYTSVEYARSWAERIAKLCAHAKEHPYLWLGEAHWRGEEREEVMRTE